MSPDTKRCLGNGRGSRVRTRDLRFWRPSLYQLSYTPKAGGSNTTAPMRDQVPISRFCDHVGSPSDHAGACGKVLFFTAPGETVSKPHVHPCTGLCDAPFTTSLRHDFHAPIARALAAETWETPYFEGTRGPNRLHMENRRSGSREQCSETA